MSSSASTGNAVTRFLARRWLSLVLIIVAAVFIAQNRNRVSVDLFWMNLSAPLWLILLVLFVVGLIAGAANANRRTRRR